MKEKLLLLEAEKSDQSKDIIWYRTQAKSFNKANQDLQKKLIELERIVNSEPDKKEAKDDLDAAIIDLDELISDDEEKLEDNNKELGDNSDKPSTSKQTGQARQLRGQIDRKENSSSKRSRSRTPIEQSSKYRRIEQREEESTGARRSPAIFGVELSLGIKNRTRKDKLIPTFGHNEKEYK